MTSLDYFVLVTVGLSVAFGAAKGILKGLISILSALIGLIAAAYFYSYVSPVFSSFAASAKSANLMGFVTIFLLVLVAGALLSAWLRGNLRRVRLDWIDHILGAVFGLIRGWIICSAVYLALTAFPAKIESVERSVFAPVLLEGTRVVIYLTSSELRERFYEGYAKVKMFWEKQN
jgi:membrane protein required for colicin V production